MGRLEDKVTIVTGGSRGIGRAIARAFAREGARLAIASRNADKLQEVAAEIGSEGAAVMAVPADVTDEAQVVTLFERTVREFGRLDILVNNAGTTAMGPIDTLTLEQWHKVIGVNLTGAFLCSREAMKIMKPQQSGRIINFGSVSAQMPRKNSVPYSTSKAGIVGLTRATALEGRAFGVVASCLHPGNVASELTEDLDPSVQAEAMMTPDEVARSVVTMAAMPPDINMLEAIVLSVEMPYLGRG